MADDNKTSIDINSDKQKQIDQYTKSIDSLRDSINGLSKPFNTFSNSANSLGNDLLKVTDSITKLNTQNQEFIISGDKTKNKISDLSSSFTVWGTVINLVRDATAAWQTALTGGLTILTIYGPEIIKFATSLLKGKEAINAMAINFKNLNDVMKASNTDAATQITRLNVLYKSATDVNNSYANRIKSVKELKQEFPDHLKNLKDEDILNGNAKKTYKELTQSIIDNARAKAALSKITEAENKLLDADYQIEKIKNANDNEVNRAKANFAKQPTPYKGGRSDSNLKIEINDSNARAQQSLTIQEQLKTTLQANIDYLMKFAGGANAIANAISSDDNSGSGSGRKKQSTETHLNVQVSTSDPDLQKESAQNQLQQKTDDFNKQLELEQNNYATGQAALKDQLDKKLITQDDYFQQWEQLQDKYHAGIGEKIKLFNEQDLAQTQQHQKDLVNAQQQNDTLGKDEQNINKAILPAQKLDAEKQLITDKYNFEIQKAADAGKDTAAIREQYQQEITATTKKYEQQRTDFELQQAQSVSNAAFAILQNSIKAQSDAQVKQLETQKTAELNNSSLTGAQKQAITDKYQKQEAAVKVKAFKDEQKASMLQAVINGALAITKATAQDGVLSAFVIPGIIAETAVQVATIAAQKAPQYAKGGIHYQSDGKGALLSGYSRTDNTNAHLRSGEAIVVSEAMRDPWARNLVSAINVAYGGRDFSMRNPGRGYAIGGIFTDGGNSNRYYNQPVNDQKDLANTIAYQMINNFPPVYVDVKDINNQQNILAQTVNRVNL